MSEQHDPATDPPGAVSNQNGEEAQSGHRKDGTHPEPRTSGRPARNRGKRSDSTGAAGEGSQSTGHPHNAG
jgi:hypothetical protein